MGEQRRAAVAAMLGARSVAVVGASARPDSFGARMIVESQRSSARMPLVNPRYDSAQFQRLANFDEVYANKDIVIYHKK